MGVSNKKDLVKDEFFFCLFLMHKYINNSIFNSCIFLPFRYGNEYEPYARPDSNMGFVMNGHPTDEYGQPLVDEYGQPCDEYGRPLMLDEYEQYPPGGEHYPPGGGHYPPGYPQQYPQGYVDQDDEYDYGYHQGGR